MVDTVESLSIFEATSHIASLILITGVSGAGKSTALDLLADSGYYVIDNLPSQIVSNFLEFSKGGKERFKHTALLLNVDSLESRQQILPLLRSKEPRPKNVRCIFLDADNRAIIKRYSETRRPHPGFDPLKDRSLEDTIARERARLQPIKEAADLIIDTSSFTVHSFKRELREFLLTIGAAEKQSMRVNFLSFGFKRGAPIDCDLIVDVRFLKNPYFIEELREKDGREAGVRDYVLSAPEAQDFIIRYSDLLAFLIPKYQFEGKAYLNIGIGCTGGMHRSVAIAEELSKRVDPQMYFVSVKHRDL